MRKSLHIALSAHRLLCSVSAVVLPANMYGENLSGFWSMSSTQAWLNSATEDWSSSVLAVVLDIQVKTFDMTIRVVHETWHTPLKQKKTLSVHCWRSSNTSNMKQVGSVYEFGLENFFIHSSMRTSIFMQNHHFYLKYFLNASSHLNKRVCPSVRWSVYPSVYQRVVGPTGMNRIFYAWKHLFSIAPRA